MKVASATEICEDRGLLPVDTLRKAYEHDEAYSRLIMDALAVCHQYRPKFGKGRRSGYTLGQFQEMYQADPFYSWFGLDSPLVYAAHKAAGGITSVYRQIGIACERLIRQVFQDALGLTCEDAEWSYQVRVLDGEPWDSSYVFSKDVLGYDLAGFFERTSPNIKGEVQRIIQDLLE